MLLCALTGGIGCGKSTVVRYFRARSIPVIDADEIARSVVEPGKPAYLKLRNEFGSEYFDEENGGQLMREKLGNLVFNDAEKRRKLNAITHPAIRNQIILQILWAFVRFERILILDVPLFFESGAYGFIKTIIVIHCTPEKQLERLMLRDHTLSPEQLQARISSQLPSDYKIQRSTFSIDNNGSIEETNQQLEKIYEELNKSWQPFIVRSIIISGISIVFWFLSTRFF